METVDIATRLPRVIEQLEDNWQSLIAIAPPRRLTEISQLIEDLPEPYQLQARNWIAKYMISTMSLHILSLMVTLRDHAEEEDILLSDCLEILEEVSPQTFEILGKLDAKIHIRSLDDLVLLGYSTESLEILSRPISANKAQSWLYDFAEIYDERLRELHIIANDQAKNEATLSSLSQLSATEEDEEEIDIELRTQRVIGHLEDAWQELLSIAPPRHLSGIVQVINDLPVPQQAEARNWLAKYMIGTMSLHILSLMATFRDHAKEEDISPAACLEILEEISLQTFEILGKLDANLQIHSLDDLLLLSYITDSLETLSQPTSAARARNWLSGLAKIYYEYIKKMRLIAEDMGESKTKSSFGVFMPHEEEKEHILKNGLNGTQNGSHRVQTACGDLELVS